jgi:phage gp36-like protein
MAYCTLDDLKEKISEDELIELTDDDDVGVIDISRTDRAISDAATKIDAYCAARYRVPLDPIPEIIRMLSVDIAIYNLLQRRSGATEARQRDYKDAVSFLQNVASGKATLGQQPEPESPDESTGQASLVGTRTKIFGPDVMEKY